MHPNLQELFPELSAADLEEKSRGLKPDIFTVFRELSLALYASVLLISSGIGILIYKHLDETTHILLLIVLTLLFLLSLRYILKHKTDWSPEKTTHPSPFYDHLVLGNTLILVSLLTYLQFRYALYPYVINYFITGIYALYIAYRLDHLGVLNIGLGAIAAIIGINLKPDLFLQEGPFAAPEYAYLVFGSILFGAGYWLRAKNIKAHFFDWYLFFALHLIAMDGIRIFSDGFRASWVLLPAGAIIYYTYRSAFSLRSFSLLFSSIVYAIVFVTFFFYHLVQFAEGLFTLALYGDVIFIALCGTFLVKEMKKLHQLKKSDAGIQ